MGPFHLALGPRLRLVGALALAVVAVLSMSSVAGASAPAMRARSADFPRGSLALGRPRLHSEQSVSGGVIESRVPAESRVAADELLVRYRPASRTRLLGRIRAQPSLRLVGALTEPPVVLVPRRP